MDLESLHCAGCLEPILSRLCLRDLLALGRVSQQLRNAINAEHVWREMARRFFATKAFIPSVCTRLITPGNSRDGRRADLEALPARLLKRLCTEYSIDTRGVTEKGELVRAVDAHESGVALPGEPLARFAVRVAHLDRMRTVITLDELRCLQFRHRLRRDGGLAELCAADPWWRGGPVGTTVTFDLDGSFEYHFRPDSPMLFLRDRLREAGPPRYSLRGNLLTLETFGVEGYLARHPVTWGWIAIFPASVWTSWDPPGPREDPLLDDAVVEQLIAVPNLGHPLCRPFGYHLH